MCHSDQVKLMAFLRYGHRTTAENVHCDTFGAGLNTKNWWPEDAFPGSSTNMTSRCASCAKQTEPAPNKRRKGKWSGGRPLSGYDVDARGSRLIVNEAEAKLDKIRPH